MTEKQLRAEEFVREWLKRIDLKKYLRETYYTLNYKFDYPFLYHFDKLKTTEDAMTQLKAKYELRKTT